MSVQKIDNEHAIRQVEAVLLMLKATHAEEVVQGTTRDAAIGKAVRTLERAASICDSVATGLRDQMLQLRDGWPDV